MYKFIALLTVFSITIAAQIASAQSTVTPLTINQWVHPSQAGVLTGRIVVPAGIGTSVAVMDAEVVVVRSNDGEIFRAEAKTDAMGEFSIQGVRPGVYSLTAHADHVLAVCAMHVLDSDLVGGLEFPNTALVAAAEVDLTTLETAITRYMPPASQSVQVISMSGAKLDALALRVCSDEAFRVNQFRGGMKGRLLKAGTRGEVLDSVQRTNVFIMKNGIEIARAVTNDAGEFEIASIGAGNYSLMAIGKDGLAFVGFELVGESTTTPVTTTDNMTFVRASAGSNEFVIHVAPDHNSAIPVSDAVIDEQPKNNGEVLIADGGVLHGAGGGFAGSNGGGLTGGGGFGGGGFGSGGLSGGNLGRIAALAAAGGAIAVAVNSGDDSDAEIVSAPVASPVVPN